MEAEFPQGFLSQSSQLQLRTMPKESATAKDGPGLSQGVQREILETSLMAPEPGVLIASPPTVTIAGLNWSPC
jgi:hypothetical protein